MLMQYEHVQSRSIWFYACLAIFHRILQRSAVLEHTVLWFAAPPMLQHDLNIAELYREYKTRPFFNGPLIILSLVWILIHRCFFGHNKVDSEDIERQGASKDTITLLEEAETDKYIVKVESLRSMRFISHEASIAQQRKIQIPRV
jgi:hypothetical protein